MLAGRAIVVSAHNPLFADIPGALTEKPAASDGNIDRKPWKHGKTIVNGAVRFTSVSALDKANSCLRKYYFHYVLGIKEGESDATRRGNKGHAEIEKYLLTGDKNLSANVLEGMHQIPPPGPDLAVELDLVPDLPDGTSGLAVAPLHAAGIPVVGRIDLLHERLENYGVNDVVESRDEPGILKFVDWKFPSSLDYAEKPATLGETLQMSGYAKWAFNQFPNLDRVRLSHGYFPVRGKPRHVTCIATREQIEKTWKRADALARLIRDAAREANPDKVDYNTNACYAYGKECPAKTAGLCTAGTIEQPLSEVIGQTAANRFRLKVLNGDQQMTTLAQPSSLLAQIKSRNAQVQPQGANAPATDVAPGPTGPTPAQIHAEKLRLRLEAAITKYPGIDTMLMELDKTGLGRPQLNGELAQAIADVEGISISVGSALAGTGDLGAHAFSTFEEFTQVVAEAKMIAADRMRESGQPLASVAPKITVAPSVPAPAPSPSPAATATATATLPPETPAPSTPVAPQVTAAAVADVAAEKPKKTSKKAAKKDKTEPPADAVATTSVAVPTQVPVTNLPVEETISRTISAVAETTSADASAPATTVDIAGPIYFFVDTVVDGLVNGQRVQSFWPIVNDIVQQMHQRSGQPDFRLAPKESPYGFNGWKGILGACLRQAEIPSGSYLLDGSFGEIAAVVVENMRSIVASRGGFFARGAR